MILQARAPWWMPQPKEDETFADFWLRMGMTTSKISEAITVDFPGAEDVANERLAHTYAERNRIIFRRKRFAWLKAVLG